MISARPQRARDIYAALKAQIGTGVYRPDAALPSTRTLAAELGVSRTTVTAAYEQLHSEGFITGRQGARARVAAMPAAAKPETPDDGVNAARPALSRFGERVAAMALPPRPPGSAGLVADFRYGDLASTDFPADIWKRAVAMAASRRPQRLSYDAPAGAEELRQALQGYLWRARSLRCEMDQIVIVNGSQQGLDLCARLLLEPGESFVVEDPCYGMARQVFAAAGGVAIPVEADQDGLRTDRLASLSARLAYVTPSHQYPLGGVMPVARRLELLAWARRCGACIVEDDYDSEYRYDIAPVPPLHALAEGNEIIYLGTVSKALSPTIRLGYLVLPPALAPIFTTAKALADRHAPGLEQQALTILLESGAYERHIRRSRRRNAERRATLLAALSRRLGDRIVVSGADAGLHVVLWFRDIAAADELAFVAQGRARGIGVYPIGPLYMAPKTAARPDMAGLVIGYASVEPQEIERGVAILAELVEALSPAP
ncbi:PLP-dependent aminotransferase family protein [Bosea sp. (in: a-proteobacteria)]|uniref:MocR-like pyridoxine biosynthesis transcription factor PdxR n=1 Tax=Bosea sp. (in: a-proteobacteria) TaxID=1871050 RepID=UPI001ACB789C|nr:PLP-dependent aminotransferase family protein [Bosea sp. (in: a-proteobacteria)]MBN9437306.1 PLP-dependent aminotransferase family protein [Bosea sp. (in: a-proteobacteria)]